MTFGLPPLPDSVNVFADAVLLLADAISQFFGIFPQQWGIFLDGEAVVLADNVLTMEYRQDSRISTYPQEQGAFASYNKVMMPFEAKLRFSTGGSVSDRQEMLDSIAALIGDTNLYDVVTPERIFLSCNVTHFDFKRAAENAGLLSVDVWLEEVRIAGSATFSSTKSPGTAGNVNNGLVQPGAAPANVASVDSIT